MGLKSGGQLLLLYGVVERRMNKYEALEDRYSQGKNTSTQIKNCPFAVLSPQITLELAWDYIWASALKTD